MSEREHLGDWCGLLAVLLVLTGWTWLLLWWLT
jgi:hypothetical protein